MMSKSSSIRFRARRRIWAAPAERSGDGALLSARLPRPVIHVSFMLVNEKSNLWLALVLMAVFALTRLPDMLPVNFSAAYALAFCAGVYLPRRAAWLLPLGIMLVTDILLNVFYYHVSAL